VPCVLFERPAPAETYTLSLHDALPISRGSHTRAGRLAPARTGGSWPSPGTGGVSSRGTSTAAPARAGRGSPRRRTRACGGIGGRSEEHTSELQSLTNLVCRLLLEKKKN